MACDTYFRNARSVSCFRKKQRIFGERRNTDVALTRIPTFPSTGSYFFTYLLPTLSIDWTM